MPDAPPRGSARSMLDRSTGTITGKPDRPELHSVAPGMASRLTQGTALGEIAE